MIRTAFSIFIFLTLTLLPVTARADFEADLSATGKSDYLQAFRELRAKAEAGDSGAQLNMGVIFFNGQKVAQDYAEAAKWFRLAAEQGQAQAQFNLGIMYAAGQGFQQDYAESARWYRLAADHDFAKAQLNLGVAYSYGQGVSKNEAESVKWFRLAAVHGEAQAQFNLGVIYAKGQGVTQDFAEAYRWAKLAAAQGNEIATALMIDVFRRMTPEQQARTNMPAARSKAASVANVASESDDVYIQLGAFKTQDQAANFLAKMHAKLGDIGKPYSLFTKYGWVRIHVGPYSDMSEAHRSADNLKVKLGYQPDLRQH